MPCHLSRLVIAFVLRAREPRADPPSRRLCLHASWRGGQSRDGRPIRSIAGFWVIVAVAHGLQFQGVAAVILW